MTEASLFAAVLELPTERRAAFLAEACAGDQRLRERVERLLAADEDGGGLLDRGPAVAPPEPLSAGQVYDGRYRLTEKLGEGGMGEVWAAEQTEPVPRPVALKFLHDRYAPRSAAASRFLAEARITARLQHPGIPPVHHVDETPSGRPYLVMKLIAGRTLESLLREQGPDPSRWLGVFEQVCQAVGYSHSQGVIHRDLKPGNVMVGAFGEVQVMDWGLAKVLTGRQGDSIGVPPVDSVPPAHDERTEVTALTQTGSMMGTPAYMSPEQATGRWDEVDQRADVFGLGAILCGLLTGRPPYTGGSRAVELRAGYGDVDEAFANLDNCGAPPDLVALCKHCLATDPTGRPADGAAVAEAVAGLRRAAEERARQAEVDRARAEVHAAEQRKRRRMALFAAGALTAVLIAGVAGTTVGLVWTERARRDEAAQRTAAESARDRARDVLDAMTSDVAGDSLVTQREVSEPQKRFLAGVLPYYREFAGEKTGDELSRRRIAAAAMRVGLIEDRLGRREEAAAAFRDALVGHEALAAEFPDTIQYRRDAANCHNNLANELSDLGRKGEAEDHYLRALAIREALVEEFPLPAEHRRDLGMSHNNLGLLFKDLGRFPGARDHFQSALSLREKLVAESPLSPTYRRELAATQTNMGNILADLGDRVGAEAQYQKALPILDQLAAGVPTAAEYRRELAVTLNNLGNVLTDLGKRPAAEDVLRRALGLREKLAADLPASADCRRELAATLANLGNVYVHLKNRPAAEEHYRRAIALLEKLAADFPATPAYHAQLGNTYLGFGVLVVVGGGPADSLGWLDKAIGTLTPVHEKHPDDLLVKHYLRNARRVRAEALDRLDRFGEAVKEWDRAVELSPDGERPRMRSARAYTLVKAGEVRRAVAEAEELRQLSVWTAAEWYDLACVYAVASTKTTDRKQEYADRATELLRKAVAAGWDDAEHMKEDEDLAPLRGRADFRQLIAEIEKKKPPVVPEKK